MSVQINSEQYWDSRFQTDWETLAGPEQSRFFSRLTLELLPGWLLGLLRDGSLTLADWGCAQGDGTAALTVGIPAARATGIDFSPVAVAQAASRYPEITFKAQDWLQGDDDGARYDVVFSSNTLEHFHEPFAALEVLAGRARKAVVLTLPYREVDRIQEHFYTFTPENLPSQLPGGFTLAWARVKDCKSGARGGFWGGEQVVLVYVQPEWFGTLAVPLAGMRVQHEDVEAAVELVRSTGQRELAAAERELMERTEGLEQAESKIADLERQLRQARAEVRELEAKLASTHSDLMRVADWAHRMDSAPFTYGFKRHGYRVARTLYRFLPVSHATRQRIRTAASRILARSQPAAHVVRETGELTVLDPAAYAEPGPGGTNRDVFVFSVIDWHFRIQRPQHLARGLARMGRRVFYISSSFVDASEPGFQIERLDPRLELYSVRLHVPGTPAIYFAQPAPEVQRAIELGLAKLIASYGTTSTISLLQHSFWYRIAFQMPNSIRLYDCMDHHEGFGNVPAELIAAEKEMLRRSDLVVVTSTWLEEIARRENRSVAMVRNAGEYKHFADRPADVFRDPNGRRVIGYYGAIAEWFDIELVRALARANPDCLVLLVGNDTVQAARSLRDMDNVQFTGEVPYDRLPFFLHGFDVCLLPFLLIPLTLATNPVKVYEYLSAGKPVIAVDLPEITQFGGLVRKAATHGAFIAQVREALADSGAPEVVEARRSFAREQTWDHRVADMARAVEQLDWPTVSVVVLTYNNLNLTQECLASLVRESDYPKLEIIVVDNASTDGSQDWLRTWHAQNPSAKLILNDRNLGFAAGNNVGLAAASGQYLVILNNDTVVTRGWVLTMLRHFQEDPNAGLVGPVTNNIGNEARIETRYGNDLAAMRPQAMRQTLLHMGRHFRIRTAAFFCAMMSRATYEKCGPLSEEYGLGFFEDDDYCRRVEAQGAYSLCAEDVFVHHHLSASFNKLPSREREELFARNKAIYESKWGRWEPHSYRSAATQMAPAPQTVVPAPGGRR